MLYGLMFVAQNGTKYLIDDKNPYVFFRKYTFPYNNTFKQYLSGVPLDCNPIVFFSDGRLSGLGENWGVGQVKKDGSGWYIDTAYETSVYVFIDRELAPINSSYGIAVWDETGQLSYGPQSKPLRVYTTPWPGIDGSVNLGEKVAFLPYVNKIVTSADNFRVVVMHHIRRDSSGTTLIGKDLLVAFGANPSVNFQSKSSDVFYIKESEYN